MSPNKSIDEVFSSSNRFASLDEQQFDNDIEDENLTLDQDDTVSARALEDSQKC